MISSLTETFSHVIKDKRFLGFDKADNKISNRFSFFIAKKREFNGRFHEIQGPVEVHTRFFCMHDLATDDVYALHTPEQLRNHFIYGGVGAIPVTVVTVAWNVAKMIVTLVHTVFEVFQDIYFIRHIEDVTKGFFERLRDKGVEKFDEVKECLLWIQASLGYFVAMEAAVLHALLNADNDEVLFEMKVVIARIENLWNREISFRDSTYAQLTKFNKGLEAKTKKDPNASKYEVISELLRDINWKSFFSVSYIMHCFQSRGTLSETVTMSKTVQTKDSLGLTFVETKTQDVKVKKFVIEDNTYKHSYKEFAEEMDKQDKAGNWKIDL